MQSTYATEAETDRQIQIQTTPIYSKSLQDLDPPAPAASKNKSASPSVCPIDQSLSGAVCSDPKTDSCDPCPLQLQLQSIRGSELGHLGPGDPNPVRTTGKFSQQVKLARSCELVLEMAVANARSRGLGPGLPRA